MKKGTRLVSIIIIAVIILLILSYTTVAFAMEDKFLFNTTINGVDCSLMTAEEAEEVYMSRYYSNMNFDIVDENGEFEINASNFDFTDAEKPASILSGVNKFNWGISLFKESIFNTNDGNAIEKLGDYLTETLPALNELNWRESEDAKIEFSDAANKYEITPEVIGTKLNKEEFYKALAGHIKMGEGDFVIPDIPGLYVQPEIFRDNEKLNNLLAELNDKISLDITYDVDGNIQHYDASRMKDFITINEDMTYTFDKQASVDAFIKDMNAHYTTMGTNREFVTTLGDTVTVKGGDWGWWMNQNKSKENLIGYIDAGKSTNGEFVWLQEACFTDKGDYSGNYIEIDLSNQHLYAYKDNVLVTECDIVSGCVADGNSTPGGTYTLTYKDYKAVLRGPTWESPVDYWMPFNGGIGMHDATWRGKFGGTIYKYNGSHGCINMPYKAAKEVFNTIDNSFAIICYWR